jgi:hypothetical protein
MKAKLPIALLLAGLASCPLPAAGEGGRWSSEFEARFAAGEGTAFASHRPAPQALYLAKRIGQSEFAALSPEDAAGLALRLAISADSDVRSGLSFQEAKARSTQQARLLARDLSAGGDAGIDGLLRMRSRAASESGQAQARGLADPLRKGASAVGQGGWGPH